MGDELYSCSGELDATRPAFEQFDPELPFQRANLLGQHRLADVEVFGRAREAQLLGDGEKVPELAHVHVHSHRLYQRVLDRRPRCEQHHPHDASAPPRPRRGSWPASRRGRQARAGKVADSDSGYRHVVQLRRARVPGSQQRARRSGGLGCIGHGSCCCGRWFRPASRRACGDVRMVGSLGTGARCGCRRAGDPAGRRGLRGGRGTSSRRCDGVARCASAGHSRRPPCADHRRLGRRGRFAVQIAARGGAHVIATVGSPGRGEGLRELGAAEVAVGLNDICRAGGRGARQRRRSGSVRRPLA